LTASTADSLPPGLATHPDYELKRELGRGGMGVVYLAHNRMMGRDEVLKVMGQHLVDFPGVLDRFLREIRAVARLRHPNIVTAYHATRLGQSVMFAMEYVEGDDLSRLVEIKGPMPVAHACLFIHQAALGLQHAHEEGLVHRDIKPGNLILSRKGDRLTVKILDFGLAKAAREEKVDHNLTSPGQALGTPSYIAPEQITDAQTADIRADIYSLGSTLYFLLAGRPPFRAKSVYELYQAHISRIAEPLNVLRPDVPADLAALVAKMMAKDPSQRFQTPGEVARALAPFFKNATPAPTNPRADVSPAARTASEGAYAATQLETEADRHRGRPAKTAVSVGDESQWERPSGFRETASSAEEEPEATPRGRSVWLWPSVIAGVSLFGLLAALLGWVLYRRTPHGGNVLESPPPVANPTARVFPPVPPAPDESGVPDSLPKAADKAAPELLKSDLPPGVIATTEKADGILLRYNNDSRQWERLVEPTPLRPQERLLSLDPFRSRVALGYAKLDLVRETEVVLGSAPPNESGRFQLAQGQVVLRGGSSGLPFEIQFGGKSILIMPPPGGAVGVARISSFERGVPESSRSVLQVFSSEGEVVVRSLQAGELRETLTGPGSITWDGARWTDRSDRPGPFWVTETKPNAFDQLLGQQFLNHMRLDRPVIANIVEAHEDDQKDVRRLALRALRVVGDLSFITPELIKPDDPTARREAIRVLRTAVAQGPDSMKALHDQLEREFGQPGAGTIEKLLIGFNAKEARDEATYALLVKHLSAPDVAVRELALDNLRSLTGRGDLQYDPDRLEGPGLNAWRDLLRNHELHPATVAAKRDN
jgi:serine/threonine protein kinase